jgi:hypothetical protein
MGGGQQQAPGVLAALVGGVAADVGGLGQDPARMLDHRHARRRHRFQAAPLAHEQLEAELVLQLLELLGQSRLGRVHAFGRHGDVEAGIDDGDEVAELGQGHRGETGNRRSQDDGPRRHGLGPAGPAGRWIPAAVTPA